MILSGLDRGVFSRPAGRRGTCRLPGIPWRAIAHVILRTAFMCIQRGSIPKMTEHSKKGRKEKKKKKEISHVLAQSVEATDVPQCFTDPPIYTHSSFLTEFLHCRVETAKSLEVDILSGNKKIRGERGFFLKVCVRILVKLTKEDQKQESVIQGTDWKTLLFGSWCQMAGVDFATKNAVLGLI